MFRFHHIVDTYHQPGQQKHLKHGLNHLRQRWWMVAAPIMGMIGFDPSSHKGVQLQTCSDEFK
jgi:hypothetical protein